MLHERTLFDGLILELGVPKLTRSGRGEPKTAVLLNQLQLLRTIHLIWRKVNLRAEMERQSRRGTVSWEEFLLEHSLSAYKARLCYFEFVSVLNQLGRHFGWALVPEGSRLRFFRNKVIEHWNEYSEQPSAPGFVQSRDKLAIPAVETIHTVGEKKGLGEELKRHFAAYGITLEEDFAVSFQGPAPEYSEKIYQALEQIDSSLGRKIPERVVELLFKVGFPMPITDVEEYSARLVAAIQSHFLPVPNLEAKEQKKEF